MAEPLKISSIGARPIEIDPRQMRTAKPTPAPSGESFSDVLAGAVSQVQQLQNEADTTIKRLIAGDIKDVTEAMVAVEKADVSFQTMMSVRNKMVAAYEEIMRMQV